MTWSTDLSRQEVQVWIDFNDDGIFQTTEEVTSVSGYDSVHTPNPTYMTISIPATADTGLHLMRVRGIWEYSTYGYALSTDLDPCLIQFGSSAPQYNGGDVADYVVHIMPYPVCGATPTAGAATVTPGTGGSSTLFTLGLSGSTVATGLTYQWYSSSSSTGPWTSISGATSETYSFTGISANTFYICVVNCTGYGSADTSAVGEAILMGCTPSASSWSGLVGLVFSYSSSVQYWTVPSGCSTIAVDARGAQGGLAYSGGIGGGGGRVQAYLPVTAGSVLNIYVGQVGGTYSTATCCPDATGGSTAGGTGGYYCGGGGGASDIRIGGTALSNRMIVAGGGGGGGYDCSNEYGGCGGGLTGGGGNYCGSTSTTYAGQGGTQTSGGAGATTSTGGTGTLGTGGNGEYFYYGGAGGGGYYGGGGGFYGSGGGGSSYTDASATSVTHTQCYNTSGNGLVTIFYPGDVPSYGVNIFNVTASVGVNLYDIGIDTAASSATGYLDRTAWPPITLYTGITAPCSITWGSVSNHQEAQVWIDFNNDGTFQTSEEVSGVVGYSTTSTVSPTIFGITIPFAAATGNHIMRVRAIKEDSVYGYSLSSHLDPCLIEYSSTAPEYAYGDVVDYIVTIATPPACSGTPSTGTVVVTPGEGNTTTPFTLSMTGLPVLSGITYQWQSASSASGPFTPISGATNPTYSFTGISSNTYYQCIVTCTSSSTATTSTTGEAFYINCTPSASSYTGLVPLTFHYTGGTVQTWVAPAGVTSVNVDVIAGSGGNGYSSGTGGAGGRVQATLAVTPDSTINIYVGGQGSNYTSSGTSVAVGGSIAGGAGGYYTGGGGGASDIRIGGTSLSNRVIVAGGGGGGGYDCTSEYGGAGGGLTGGAGIYCSSASTTYAGQGGTPSAGGAGATISTGGTGTLGVGGSGEYYFYGGAGGGGYYGGGGGYYGSGGGGSSYAGSAATSVTHTQGYNSGANGVVIIYAPGNMPHYGINKFYVNASTGANLRDTGIAAAADTATGYVNRTALSPITLYQGATNASSITWAIDANYQEAQVWIDFNDDGIFSPSEEVSPVVGYNTTLTPNPTTFVLTVPYSAATGNHLMRVRGIVENSTYGDTLSTDLDPCLSQYLTTAPEYNFGDAADYVVSIETPPACSGTPTAGSTLVTPATGSASTFFTLSLSGLPVVSGLTFQWEVASASTGPWINIGGATNATYSFTGITQNTYFQCVVSCTTSGLTSTSTIGEAELMTCVPTSASWEGNNRRTFFYTGSDQTMGVPTGVTSVSVDVVGAKGGNAYSSGTGGAGGRVQATLPVSSGTTLNIYVGGAGTAYTSTCCTAAGGGATVGGGGGYYAGGGGGASDIRVGGTALSNRKIVAGGGGGGGYDCTAELGGAGGGLTGGNGMYCSSTTSTTYAGQGGTQTAGGAGATTGGTSGSIGTGGASGYYYYGGGGGGGYYGGGGGYYGAGGGGSSYSDPSALSVIHTQGYNTTGNGWVTITISGDLPTYGIDKFFVTAASGSNLNDSGIVTACSASSGYLNRTTTLAPVILYTGYSAATSITWGTALNYQEAQVWIDFNDDGTYSPSEEVSGVVGYNTSSTPNPTVFNITIPTTAATGTHLMRVRGIMEYSADSEYLSSDLDPCLMQFGGFGPVYNDGDAVDYLTTITPPPSCTGSPATGIAAVSPGSGSSTTSFTLSLTGVPYALGYTFQWESSSSATGPWSPISGATTSTYTFTGITANTYYQCIVTCSYSGLSTTSTNTLATWVSCTPTNTSWAGLGSVWYFYNGTNNTTDTGTVQYFVVPTGVYSVSVDMAGAKGGFYSGVAAAVGGKGGRTQGVVNTTGIDTLYVYVGHRGDSANSSWSYLPHGGRNSGGGASGGWGSTSNGASAGGGATDIRTIPGYDSVSLASRILVAAAGAGGSWNSGEAGGAGGGLTGLSGYSSGTTLFSVSDGATQTAGGPAEGSGTAIGQPGGFGYGGNGYSTYWGSGGGGGWYGGGGAYDGSGGGGSSYYGSSLVSGGTTTANYQNADGYVKISLISDSTRYGVNAFVVTASSGSNLVDGGMCAAANPITGYLSRTTMAPIVLFQGATSPSSVTWGHATSYQEAQVWIDFNDDGIFQTSEEVSSVVGYSATSTPNPTTFNISIPSSAATGEHLMRVRGIVEDPSDYTLSSDLDPCLNQFGGSGPIYDYGDVTDYIVNIQPSSCTSAPTPGVVVASATMGCSVYSSTLTLSGATVTTGIAYQWQSSTSSSGPWTDLTGATTSTYTTTVTATGFYRCMETCTAYSASDSTVGEELNLTSLAPITGGDSVCTGYALYMADTSSGGTWTSSAPSIAAIGSTTGIVTPYTAGVWICTYTVAGCYTTQSITVNATPTSISGTPGICIGSSTTLTDSITGGTWSSGSTSIATVNAAGIVTGIAGGTAVITYSNLCGMATITVTVNATSSAITGTTVGCIGSGVTLSDAISGGTWTSGTPGVASIGSSSGIYTGASQGTTVITYTSVCGVSTATITIEMAPTTITGSVNLCVGNTSTLTETALLGSWTSGTSSVASITGDVVTALTAGSTIITYSNSCGSATIAVSVNAVPSLITGTMVICNGLSATLSDSTSVTWSSGSTTVATIGSGTGIYTGIGQGTSLITATNICGSASATITVNNAPSIIGGTLTMCGGGSTTLTDSATGGTWTTGTISVATIGSGTGIAAGHASGFSTVTYSNGCGTAATATITVSGVIGAISGTLSACVGAMTTLGDTSLGGAWISADTLVATVGAGTGIVTGVTAGTATIDYITSCGSTSIAVTINGSPVAISGTGTVCSGSITSLSDSVTGGTWSSVSTSVATVNPSTGVVTGLSQGTSVISYSNGCGTAVVLTVTVNDAPSVITGTNNICVLSSAALTDSATGGTWSSGSTSIVTVNAVGIMTGVGAGTTNVTYSNGCGSAAVIGVTVNGTPTAISGIMSMCVSGSTTLSESATGGSWSSSATAVASVGSTTGVVSPVTCGTTIISYSNGCGSPATASLTVLCTPSSITGDTMALCTGGSTMMLGETSIGGSWSSSATSVASVGPTGMVTSGTTAGTATISYSNGCGTAATVVVTVNGAPASITGTPVLCAGSTTSLSDVTSGGTWSSSSTLIATVDPAGLVSGLEGGVVTIQYSNGCGTPATKSVTVSGSIGPITGASHVCVGGTIMLADTTVGGTWSSSNTSIATISTSGLVSASAQGVDTISYNNGCTSPVSVVITVNATPATITGSGTVCVGSMITLSETSTGGTWGSTITADATVDSMGVVLGIAGGVTNITYNNGCGTMATFSLTVQPIASAITGLATLCIGSNTTYTDSTVGGSWSISNGNATINSLTGAVHAVSVGLDTITYIIGCSSRMFVVTIDSNTSPVMGIHTVCIGGIDTVTDTTPAGTWSSSMPTVATINPATGVITGLASGTTSIVYTTAGCTSLPFVLTVNGMPAAITGAASVCTGAVSILSDSTMGGIWATSDSSIAWVDSAGGVHGVAQGSVVINYNVTCGSASRIVTVVGAPAGISGSTFICVGSSSTLSDSTTGGVWSCVASPVATVNTVGVVSGLSSGTIVIDYSTSCGSATATITVNALPDPILGVTSFCQTTSVTLYDSSAGGTWSSGNPSIATVSPTGVVHGIAPGTVTVFDSLPSGCMSTAVLTVNPFPSAGLISGVGNVCVGSDITLTDTSGGGTGVWSSTNTTVAPVSTGGVVSGLVAGTTIIKYAVTNGCGTGSSSKSITVTPLPVAGAISGSNTVCAPGTTTLTDSISGGTWRIANASVATISSSGVVTGVMLGTDVVYNIFTNACGSDTARFHISVLGVPTSISGIESVCMGAADTLYDSTIGGTWSTSDHGTATANSVGDSTGVISGVDSGLVTITYSTGCGTPATITFTVNPLPDAGIITGPSSVCQLSHDTLTATVTGGSWSASNGNATVSGGIVTGVTSGNDSILYVTSNMCGSAIAYFPVTINSLPVSGSIVIGSTDSVCPGRTIVLSATATGGMWHTSNTNASVDSLGNVMGSAAGADTILYTVSSMHCGTATATLNVLVMPNPYAGSIYGTDSVCVGASTTLSDSTTGGIWTSVATGMATVNSIGKVSGLMAGMDTIHYAVTNYCGTAVASYAVKVKPLANAGTITGLDSVCAGSSITLADSVSGGTWRSVDTIGASISTTGMVTGNVAGLDTIVYAVTNTCNTAYATRTVYVKALPVAGTISVTGASTTGGVAFVCINNNYGLSSTVGGGTWSTDSTTILNVWGDTLKGIAGGLIGDLKYTVTSYGCGSAIATMNVSVADTPSTMSITSRSFACIGHRDTTDVMAGSPSGGTWTVSDTTYAKVVSSSSDTATLQAENAPGNVTVHYTINNVCGTFTTSTNIRLLTDWECDSFLAVQQIPSINGGDVVVYPNPNTGSFTVELPTVAQHTEIEIMDVYGKIIERRIITDSNIERVNFSFNNLAAGTYMIKVLSDGITYNGKLLIMKQ